MTGASRIAILLPGFASDPGGVAGHTARLVASWGEEGHRVQVIDRVSDHVHVVAGKLGQEGVQALLIQYVPFLYNRFGISQFPEALARAAATHRIRVTTFVHEPWVPPTRLPWLVLSPIQRRQLRRLQATCDVVVTAVPAWQGILGGDPELVYVGSNLGTVPKESSSQPQLAGPVVFSPFAAGLNWKWIASAARAGSMKLTVVGADYEQAKKHRQVGRWAQQSWHWLGRLPPEEALAIIARAPFALAPFIDGATGRRTSLLALLSTGTQVISSTGHLVDPLFQHGPLTLSSSEEEFVDAALQQRKSSDPPEARERRLAWYRDHLDPAMLDRRLLNLVLGSTPNP